MSPLLVVPPGAALYDVDSVPVFKLADGSAVFAKDPSRPFLSAAMFAKGDKVSPEEFAADEARFAAFKESSKAAA